MLRKRSILKIFRKIANWKVLSAVGISAIVLTGSGFVIHPGGFDLFSSGTSSLPIVEKTDPIAKNGLAIDNLSSKQEKTAKAEAEAKREAEEEQKRLAEEEKRQAESESTNNANTDGGYTSTQPQSVSYQQNGYGNYNGAGQSGGVYSDNIAGYTESQTIGCGGLWNYRIDGFYAAEQDCPGNYKYLQMQNGDRLNLNGKQYEVVGSQDLNYNVHNTSDLDTSGSDIQVQTCYNDRNPGDVRVVKFKQVG